MSLGKTIAELRKERGLTQVELAEKLGVHQSHITRWESGRVRPRHNTLESIAEVLDITAEELLVGGKEALKEVSALKVLLKGLMSRVRVREALG